jgi:hypothetical protein
MIMASGDVAYDVPCNYISPIHQLAVAMEDPACNLTKAEKETLAGECSALTL